MDGHDTTLALLGWEIGELRESRPLVLKADEPEAGMTLGRRQVISCWVTNHHAEPLA